MEETFMKMALYGLLFLCAGVALAGTPLNISFQKYTLANGLNVILHEDHSVPIVAVNVWYHVGSSREKPGRTGFAHLFEHMMFQGSDHVEKGGHFGKIQDAGGTLNGSTTNDRTNYFETVPSQFLELALWLESDRMGYLLPAMNQAKLDNQRDVVKNERRQSYENQPYGRADETLSAMMYDAAHPYSWPVIGSMADLSTASLDDVKEFFSFYYAPNNASVCIAGDFNPSQVKEWVAKYFSSIPRGKNVAPIKEEQPSTTTAKRDVMEDRVQLPRLYAAWHTTPLFGKDDAALDIVADILAGGKNSRLYKALVYDKQIAQEVSAYQYSRERAGAFYIEITAKPGISLSEIEKAMREEIAGIQKNGVSDREVQRARNGIRSQFIFRLQSVAGKADQLNSYNVMRGDPGVMNKDLSRYDGITAERVQRAARKYLTPEAVILSIVPTGKKELGAQ